MISALDKKIISLMSQDLPSVSRPFAVLADKLGIKEDKLLDRIKSYKKNALMRKCAAVLNHRKVGFNYNAMVVWNLPDKSILTAGRKIAAFSEVTHCYQRKKAPNWKYNMYAMVHAKDKKTCLSTVKKISKKIGFDDCKVLLSSKEYKKTGVKY